MWNPFVEELRGTLSGRSWHLECNNACAVKKNKLAKKVSTNFFPYIKLVKMWWKKRLCKRCQKSAIFMLFKFILDFRIFLVEDFTNYFCIRAGVKKNECRIQVSLAIRGGYVPKKSQTANTKTPILSLILA